MDYQSVRHCSKTPRRRRTRRRRLDYQSVRHCSKTPGVFLRPSARWITSQFDTAPKLRSLPKDCKLVGLPVSSTLLQNTARCMPRHVRLDYQSVRHCSKTEAIKAYLDTPLDYQSVRHCSKTGFPVGERFRGLDYQSVRHCSKTGAQLVTDRTRWITSQFDTAPKQSAYIVFPNCVGLPVSSTLLQNCERERL